MAKRRKVHVGGYTMHRRGKSFHVRGYLRRNPRKR